MGEVTSLNSQGYVDGEVGVNGNSREMMWRIVGKQPLTLKYLARVFSLKSYL